MTREKNPHIETIRGIAIILVVMGHVIGMDAMGGMRVADDSIYRYLYCLFETIRMPLFTVISGFIYAIHPIKFESLLPFIGKKARRLIVPMIVVGTTYFLLQYMIPGTNMKGNLAQIWEIYLFPYTYFWYLPALFSVFLIVAVLELGNALQNMKQWIICFIIAILLCFSELYDIIPKTIVNVFAFKNTLFLLPFFLFGLGLERFNTELVNRKTLFFYGICTIIGILFQQLSYFYPEQCGFFEEYNLKIFTGITASALILHLKWVNKYMIYIAGYAYTIYLFHGFGTAGGRIILKGVGVTSDFLIFAITLLIAIIAPIFVDKVFSNWNLTRLIFLGKGRKKV